MDWVEQKRRRKKKRRKKSPVQSSPVVLIRNIGPQCRQLGVRGSRNNKGLGDKNQEGGFCFFKKSPTVSSHPNGVLCLMSYGDERQPKSDPQVLSLISGDVVVIGKHRE